MRSMMSTKSNWLEFRTLTTLKCLSFVIKTFISCKIIVYILHTWAHGCSGFNRLLFFHFCISHWVNIAIIANGRGGLLKKMHAGFQPHVLLPVFWMKSTFWIKVPWLSGEERNKGNERRPQAKEGCTGRVCGVEFFLSGSHPSYWAALEGTFLRLKFDQFTATFWRVCFAESRQNLKRTHAEKRQEKGYLKYGIHFEKSNMSLVSVTMWSYSFKSLNKKEKNSKLGTFPSSGYSRWLVLSENEWTRYHSMVAMKCTRSRGFKKGNKNSHVKSPWQQRSWQIESKDIF